MDYRIEHDSMGEVKVPADSGQLKLREAMKILRSA